MIYVRVDDFPFTKEEEVWRHNLENFKKFDAVFAKYNLGYVLGVIPSKVTDEQLKWLADNDRIEVALHGINHDERFPNEFRDFETEKDIYGKLVAGVQKIASCNGDGKVSKYIPPHNVIDRKTCTALLRAGFTTILGGPGTTKEAIEKINLFGFDFHFSESPFFYGRSDEMMDVGAPDIIRNHARIQGTDSFLTLHWTWELNIGLESLDLFLSKIRSVL